MTTKAITTEVPTGYEVVFVDPTTLKDNPDNARGAKRDRLSLVESIKSLGVLTPLTARVDEAGSLVLIAGERRKYSAIEAGVAKVPVLLRSDLSDVQRLAGMLVENTNRENLTTVEEITTLARLAGFESVTVAQVAGMTGVKPAVVRNAVKVAASDTARNLTERHNLTLEQALAIAEFEDDAEAVEALTESATEWPEQFKHVVSRLRVNRKDAKVRAALVAELEEAGLTVIDWPSYNSGPTRLSSLAGTKGKGLTAKAHAKCPGHVVALSPWNSGQVEYFCTDAKGNGHTSRHGDELVVTKTGPLDEDAKAERRTVIENNKAWVAAEIVRHEFIVELLSRKSAPKGTLTYAVNDCLTYPALLDAPEAQLTAFTGVSASRGWGHDVAVKYAKGMSEARLPLALLAQVGASIEKATTKNSWRNPSTRVALWFTYLVSAGYTLSPVEQLVVDGCTEQAKEVDED